MSNFSPKLQDATDGELMHMVNELDFRAVPLASDELTRRSIKDLTKAIEKMDRSSSKYSQAMMNLTWLMLYIALIQILITLVIPNNAKLYIKFVASIIIIIGLIIFAKRLLKKI